LHTGSVRPDPETPRPIEAVDTVFMEDLTWMEVRDALRAGKDTVIVATGGVEQNGPYLVTGKHNVVLRGTTEAIARKLGNALVAPIVPFVPEGDIEPPGLHMKYPGTISVTEATYEALLWILHRWRLRLQASFSLATAAEPGWPDGCQPEQESQRRTTVLHSESRISPPWRSGWKNRASADVRGLHDDFGMTAMMMSIDPKAFARDSASPASSASMS
jgi:creatinine amidohydrolase/Fe(II)-dependent formamide hydrolase-like protein